jgi:hypothetical protein
VLVVRDDQAPWDEVAALLEKANARVVSCTQEEVAAAADEAGPDLVLWSDRVRRGARPAVQRPQLVMRPDGEGVLFVEGSRPPVAFFSWPLPEEVFLELTARMLRVSERRSFRALIRVLRTRTRESAMGTSQDFSLSGVAFRTSLTLQCGEPIVVSLHLPGGRGSVQLLGEVSRQAIDPADGEPYYGARFVGLEPEVRTLLRDFVWEAR